ncbi:MAG: hypothetical protein IKQ71_04655 [Lachnospiraceae bacterium]|jgi:hypothetical protein|nr:hypothetical protein [Lachnospiraceae bacterium]
MMSVVDENKLYAIKFPGRSEPIELVMYVTTNFRNFPGICYYTAGNRGHMIEGHLGENTDRGFLFYPDNRSGGKPWEFIEMTYDFFKSGFYKHIECGEKLLDEFSNTEEMEEWYHRAFPRRQL